MKTVRIPKRWLSKISRIAVASAVMLSSRSALTQEGPSVFSRTPLEGPTGSASEVVDSNRRGFGVAFRAGHVAGDTVGRSDSISTISLMPYLNVEDGLLFGDTRFFRGNEGGLGWNFGSGYRHYISDWDVVLGGNGYFDRDELSGTYLKQWGLGAELLAHGWEARGNYYNTFGETSDLVSSRVDQGSVAFVGNNIQYARIDTVAEGLQGWDSEFGFLLPGDISERFDVRAFGGGYYYEGENIDGFGGWSTRLQADIARWLELGVKLTDDEMFNTTVSFNVAVHFGEFHSEEHVKKSALQRLGDPVRRNMNIVAADTDIRVGGQIATDPGTNNPFVVAHVNSNDAVGPFTGTAENPFNSLTTGLGSGADIVLVHAGSQFAGLPDNTVVLDPGQQLFGEGLIVAGTDSRLVENRVSLGGLGDIVLPQTQTYFDRLAANLSVDRPSLLNSGGTAVTMADNSQLSGFLIDTPAGNGILSSGARNIIINDVLVRNAGQSGIRLQNTVDATTIRNTIIENATGPAFHVSGGSGRIGYGSTSTDPNTSFARIINSSQEAILIENMTGGGSVNMLGSTVDDTGGAGILIRNNAGSATIDNANIVNSTGNGIAVLDSSGVYTFRDTIRTAATISGATDESLLIDGLAATGRVSFENLSILNRQAAGIRILDLAGQVNAGSQSTLIDTPASGADPAVSVTGSAATGAVSFGRGLTINGSGGRGIDLTGNAAGSSFTVTGPLAVSDAATEAIAIVNDSATVSFAGGTRITDRSSTGILIDNSDGAVSFAGATAVSNANASVSSGVIIRNSEATVGFQGLSITDALDSPALLITNNIAGTAGNALVGITNLVVTSTAGEGLLALNNSRIRIGTGTIATQSETAVDIEESGIDITLEGVDSSGASDHGIRLVETNKDPNRLNQFKVTGDLAQAGIGTGGRIEGAGVAGVFLQNAGQVGLRSMVLDDNQNGIIVENSGLDVADEQVLNVSLSQISRSNVRGIYSLNLIQLDVRDSQLFDNGDDAALGRETILAVYNERLNNDDTNEFEDFDNPYTITLLRNTILDNSTDAIVIGSLTGASGAHLGIDMQRNNITVTDTSDPTDQLNTVFPVNTFDNDRSRDDAIVVRWNGPTFQNYVTNSFIMNGTGPQTAFDLQSLSSTDLYNLNLSGNQLDSTVTGTVTGQQIGLLMRTFGPSSASIISNDFRFTGGEGRGIDLTLASQALINVSDNTILDFTDGGAGIIFNSVSQPSTFTISGNNIGLFDTGSGIEEGIRFNAVAGTVNLRGDQNNQVVLGNPNAAGAFIETIFSMPAGTNNGQIIINGDLVP